MEDAGGGRVVHIAPTTYGPVPGVAEDVSRLCRSMSAQGWDARLLAVGDMASASNPGHAEIYPNLFAGIPLAAKLCVSPKLSVALKRHVPAADIVHTHGLWLMPGAYAAREARCAAKPYIIATRGMLAPAALRIGVPQKRFFWWTNQRGALQRATCLHATSEQEYEDIRSLGLTTPVAIIPLGVEPAEETGLKRSAGIDRIVLSLGRLHPIKGLDVLLAAWRRVEAENPGWRLQIAGPSEGSYGATLHSLAATLGTSRVEFLGMLTGSAKAEAFARADVFVLPSHSENFALTVPEALSYGIPVAASRGTPWSSLEEKRCGWWFELGVEPLAKTLSHVMRLPRAELYAMGDRGRQWVAQDFTWENVAQRMSTVYCWMRGTADAPLDVRFD